MIEKFVKSFTEKIDRIATQGNRKVHEYVIEQEKEWRWWNKYTGKQIYTIKYPYTFEAANVKSKELNIDEAIDAALQRGIYNKFYWKLIIAAKNKPYVKYSTYIFEQPEDPERWPFLQRLDQAENGMLYVHKRFTQFERKVKEKYQNDILADVIVDGIVEVLVSELVAESNK